MSHAEWVQVWPWIDNLWSMQGGNFRGKTYYSYILKYRFWRAQQIKSRCKGERERSIRKVDKGEECRTICTVRFFLPDGEDLRTYHGEWRRAPVDYVTVSRTKESLGIDHNHALEDLDDFKRNSGLRSAAGVQVAKNYAPSVVARNLRADTDEVAKKQLLDAGGAAISLLDVHNAARAHKQANPDPRKVGGKFSEDDQVTELKDWLDEQVAGTYRARGVVKSYRTRY